MPLIHRITIFILFISSWSSPFARAEDISGTWHFDYGYNMTFSGSGGTFSGFGGEGSAYTWSVSNGIISGNSVSWSEDYNEISYHVDRQGTISGDSMSGTFTSSWGQNGNWTATRISGGGGGNGGDNGNKRRTSINLFCNRTGVGLATAACSATVADAGAPPRSSPTGIVSALASQGFFPEEAECLLTQTQYSPGISSCEIQFAVPAGFPIGVKFPIEAAYAGDQTFEPSTTSHELIKAGCISTPETPCPDSIGLSFEDYPQIIKNKLALFISCGSPIAPAKSNITLGGQNDPAFCSVSGTYALDVEAFLKGLTIEELQLMSPKISPKMADKDGLLKVLRDASKLKQERLQLLQQNQDAILKLQNDIIKNRVKVDPKKNVNFDAYMQSSARLPASVARAQRLKTPDRLDSQVLNAKVKRSSQKRVFLKNRIRLSNLLSVVRRAAIDTLPFKLRFRVKQKGVRGTGIIRQDFNVAVR